MPHDPALPEEILQYAWLKRRFSLAQLTLTDGRPVHIQHPGRWNTDQGPDFLDARIAVAGTVWAGHVEIHRSSNDWYAHGHHTDPHYNPVVLHVVAHSDGQPILRQDGTEIPELILGQLLEPGLLHRYGRLRAAEGAFPCAATVARVPEFHRKRWVELMGWERFQEKVAALEHRLSAASYDWEQLLWTLIAGALGGSVNRAPMEALAERVPYERVRRHQERPEQLAALLFGAAGLLPPENPDSYSETLIPEWKHLQAVYNTRPLAPAQWRFARIRPVNFPTLRIAQLAAIGTHWPGPLDLAADPIALLKAPPALPVAPYWETHYRFGEPAKAPRKRGLGKTFLEGLLINALVPASVLYYRTLNREADVQRVLDSLQELHPENNKIVRRYTAHGFPAENALDTQGLLHLERAYCSPRRCLRCGIGQKLLQLEA